MASTKDVLDNHLKCFGEGDLTGTTITDAITQRGADCLLVRPAYRSLAAGAF